MAERAKKDEKESEAELLQKIFDARSKVVFGGRYAHYKHPQQYYLVQGFAIIEATGSVGVIYQAQYGERLTFIRPLGNWLAEVDHGNKKVPRFKQVEPDENTDGQESGL